MLRVIISSYSIYIQKISKYTVRLFDIIKIFCDTRTKRKGLLKKKKIKQQSQLYVSQYERGIERNKIHLKYVSSINVCTPRKKVLDFHRSPVHIQLNKSELTIQQDDN